MECLNEIVDEKGRDIADSAYIGIACELAGVLLSADNKLGVYRSITGDLKQVYFYLQDLDTSVDVKIDSTVKNVSFEKIVKAVKNKQNTVSVTEDRYTGLLKLMSLRKDKFEII